jgi:hypothetical protein
MKSLETDTSFKGFVKTTTALTIGSIVGMAGTVMTGSPDLTVKSWANTEKKPVSKTGTAVRTGLTVLWAVALLHNVEHHDPIDEVVDAAALAATATGLVVSRVNARRGSVEAAANQSNVVHSDLSGPASINLEATDQIIIHKSAE